MEKNCRRYILKLSFLNYFCLLSRRSMFIALFVSLLLIPHSSIMAKGRMKSREAKVHREFHGAANNIDTEIEADELAQFNWCLRKDELFSLARDYKDRQRWHASPKIEDVFVDTIVVTKGNRELYALSDGRVVGVFDIRLGERPVGRKTNEGDSRTPEGIYSIQQFKAASRYTKALVLDYPNANDRAYARNHGIQRPGNMIEIHGSPGPAEVAHQLGRNWTSGCIALKDSDILTLYPRVRESTAIEICPFDPSEPDFNRSY